MYIYVCAIYIYIHMCMSSHIAPPRGDGKCTEFTKFTTDAKFTTDVTLTSLNAALRKGSLKG